MHVRTIDPPEDLDLINLGNAVICLAPISWRGKPFQVVFSGIDWLILEGDNIWKQKISSANILLWLLATEERNIDDPEFLRDAGWKLI